MHKTTLFAALICLFACKEAKNTEVQFSTPPPTLAELEKHSDQFRQPEVIEVTEGVHLAVGFGLANSILIEGKNGNIIVDCTESDGVARKVKAVFNKISEKPIKAIIYTHYHPDHIFGSGVMAGEDKPAVYAHELTNYYIDRMVSVVQPITLLRGYRMFGQRLDGEHVNCGIGPHLDSDADTERSLLRPTVTFKDELALEIEGVKLKLVHAPGETNDQIFVWLPEKKTLLPGDNFYNTFPNLYTIRGTPYRDVKEWAASLDKMRYLKPAFLVPSHTQPLSGEVTIENALRDYRDGIQFVHDQTVRYINKGLTPDEIVERVKLPEHLAKSPYLKEFYGRVDWSVRNVFTGYLGFFDGNATTLLPLSTKEKAQKMAELAGGPEQLAEKASDALEKGAFQWALELSDYLLRLKPGDEQATNIRYESLVGLGGQQSNPNARSYYLSQAKEAKGQDMQANLVMDVEILKGVPMSAVFSTIAVNLQAEKCLDFDKKTVFNFTDSNEKWSLHIRRGVAEIQPFALENPDFTVTTTSQVWKEIVTEIRSPLVAVATGKLKIKGGMGDFKEMMTFFKYSE